MSQLLVSEPGDHPEKARADFDQFFSCIGYAITRWAHVDRNLFEFCNFAISSSKEMTASVFYRSPSIREHLLLTDSLLKYVLSKAHMKKWKVIFELAEEHLPFRNDLAHNPPTQVVEMKLFAGAKPEFAQPPQEIFWEIRTEETKLLHKKGKNLRARKENIVGHIIAVNQLLYKMHVFAMALPNRRRLQQSKSSGPKSPALSGSKNNNHRSRTKHQRPPQSSRA